MMTFLNILMLENNGINVKVSKKSEIKLTVDLAGPLELLNLSLIDGVLQVDKKTKLECLLNNF